VAFDINNPVDVAALKTELTNDPVLVGYNLNGSVSQIVKLVNDPDSNTGGAGRGETINETLTTRRLWEISADNPDDLTPHGQFSVGDQFVMQQLFEVTQGLDDDLEWARDRVINLFPAQDGIVTSINALTRVMSRAEVLFGAATVLSENDVNTALSS
jgi:hypothetical protein